MGRMKDAFMRREEIANRGSLAEVIREFGSVCDAKTWLRQQEFWRDLADRMDPEALPAPEPLSHKQWRADQITEGKPTPARRLRFE